MSTNPGKAVPPKLTLYVGVDELKRLGPVPAANFYAGHGVDQIIVGAPNDYLVYDTTKNARYDDYLTGVRDRVGPDVPLWLGVSTTNPEDPRTPAVGDTRTLIPWENEQGWAMIDANLRGLAQAGARHKVSGYLLDFEMYGPQMPTQVPGQAWPDGDRKLIESRAHLMATALRSADPAVWLGGFVCHVWEDDFPGYRKFTRQFFADALSGTGRAIYYDESTYGGGTHLYSPDWIAKLENYYGIPNACTALQISVSVQIDKSPRRAATADEMVHRCGSAQGPLKKAIKNGGSVMVYCNEDPFRTYPQNGAFWPQVFQWARDTGGTGPAPFPTPKF